MTKLISSITAVHVSTVVALARECEDGSLIAHTVMDSLGDDQAAELRDRLDRRGLVVESSSGGYAVRVADEAIDPDADCREHGCARWRCDHGDRPSTTVLVTANPDEDDCLTAAADAYIAEHPELEGWDLAPQWEPDHGRRYVTLTVPVWHLKPAPSEES